jgi:hypothetical protein
VTGGAGLMRWVSEMRVEVGVGSTASWSASRGGGRRQRLPVATAGWFVAVEATKVRQRAFSPVRSTISTRRGSSRSPTPPPPTMAADRARPPSSFSDDGSGLSRSSFSTSSFSPPWLQIRVRPPALVASRHLGDPQDTIGKFYGERRGDSGGEVRQQGGKAAVDRCGW